jgi:hypothetical protein
MALLQAYNNGDDQRKETARALTHAGACRAVVAVLALHAADQHVAERGCVSVSTMLTSSSSSGADELSDDSSECEQDDDDNCRTDIQLYAAGACAVVVGALNKHTESKAVAKAACTAIVSLLDSGDDQNRLVTAGASEAVVAALQAHTGNTAVAKAACTAIVSLLDCGGDQNTLVTAGACEAVVRALRADTSKTAVAEQACLAIIALARTKTNIARLKRIGTAAAVKPLVAEHSCCNAATQECAEQVLVLITPRWRRQLQGVVMPVAASVLGSSAVLYVVCAVLASVLRRFTA